MEHHFQTAHIKDDLKGLSVRGSSSTVAAQMPKFVLMLISNFVVLRFLSPGEVGLYGMATISTGLVLLFQDLGLPAATVQKEDITHELASALFWINLATSLVLMVVAIFLAPAVSMLFGEPRIEALIVVIACSFVLSALSSQHQALMQRNMKFPMLAFIEIVAMAAGVTVGIILAVRGGGYWALAIMPIATSLVSMIGLWVTSGWIPALPRRGTGVRSMLKFGLNLTSSRVFNYITEKIDYMLVGWMWGAGPLGIYVKGYQLLTLAQSQLKAPISRVAISGLSRLCAEPERYARYYLKIIRGLAWLTAPITGVLAAVATDLIVVILLPRWAMAGEIFRIFAFLAILKPVHDSVVWVFVSQGRTDRFRLWSIMYFAVVTLAVIVGLPFGIKGVAVSYTVFYIAGIIPWSLPLAYKGTEIKVASVLKSTGVACSCGYLLYGVGYLVTSVLTEISPILRMSVTIAACAATSGVVYILSSSVRKEIQELLEMRSQLSKTSN